MRDKHLKAVDGLAYCGQRWTGSEPLAGAPGYLRDWLGATTLYDAGDVFGVRGRIRAMSCAMGQRLWWGVVLPAADDRWAWWFLVRLPYWPRLKKDVRDGETDQHR